MSLGTNPPGAVTIQPISSASPHETVPMAVEGSVMPMLKKKKFVQFDELKNSYHESVEMDQNLVEATFETTTMDYEQTTSREPNLFFRDRDDELPLPREKARPPTPPRSSSRSPNQPNIQTTLTPSQDVAKRCLLGTEGRSISLVFKIAPHCPHPWLSNFKTRDKVIFSHVCVAQDFLQLWKVGENARQYDLASGYISCPTESIDHVVDRLKLNSQGIMSRAEGYYILCIPNKSEEWDSMAVNGTHSDGLPFRFVVFQPAGDLSAFFAPNPQKTLDRETQDSQKETMIKRGLTKFLSLNYAKLIPRAMQDSKEHQFFLAFPVADNYAEETRFMTQWLDSSSTATCCIYSGETPGAWREFVDGGRTGSGGIIILHEDTMWHVRLFPNMFAILESNMFPVYVFTRGLQENRLFPSAYTLPARPGILNLEQVFWPGRKAFMLTPSFLLSGPHEAAAFVKWFRATYDKSDNDIGGTGRLVVCSDFAEWLLDLVLNQSANQSHKSHGSEFEAWNQLWRDFADLESRADFVIVAPSSLDGNDEQSLVNWFGFWSLRNMDSVCLCYVLGSISNRWGDMTKRVGPLRFVKGTLFDPNAAEDEFDIHEMNVEFGEQNGALRLIQNESCEEIASFLLRFQFPRGGPKERAPFSFVSVFSRPVSYWKLDIGAALGDREYKFSTFSEWYEYTSYGFKASSNTYGGLFYTIETAWVGQTLLPSQTKRRPWLAFLRPCNPHQRPWETLELFIWDPSYRNSFTGRAEIQEEELIDAQRQLMKLVAGQYRLPLKAVRVGWEDSSNPNGRRSHPMDQCLEMLGNCVHNTWMMLPAPEHSLASHGWVLVTPYDRAQPKKRDESDRPRPDTGASPEAMDIDLELGKGSEKDREENLDNMRVVFHPPRSPLRHHGNSRPSICKNLLVKYLREVEKRTASSNSKYPRGSIFDYRFTPTMVWYDKQIKEGRDFKHMMVAPFDRVFQQLGIQLS